LFYHEWFSPMIDVEVLRACSAMDDT
jgi:hypothetical protein